MITDCSINSFRNWWCCIVFLWTDFLGFVLTGHSGIGSRVFQGLKKKMIDIALLNNIFLYLFGTTIHCMVKNLSGLRIRSSFFIFVHATLICLIAAKHVSNGVRLQIVSLRLAKLSLQLYYTVIIFTTSTAEQNRNLSKNDLGSRKSFPNEGKHL